MKKRFQDSVSATTSQSLATGIQLSHQHISSTGAALKDLQSIMVTSNPSAGERSESMTTEKEKVGKDSFTYKEGIIAVVLGSIELREVDDTFKAQEPVSEGDIRQGRMSTQKRSRRRRQG